MRNKFSSFNATPKMGITKAPLIGARRQLKKLTSVKKIASRSLQLSIKLVTIKSDAA